MKSWLSVKGPDPPQCRAASDRNSRARVSSRLVLVRPLRCFVAILVLGAGASATRADPDAAGRADAYAAELSRIAERRAELAGRWAGAVGRAVPVERIAAEITASVHELSRHWLGTRWGLGPPQASHPGQGGKINCGTFVGRVLRDAGFVVDVARLQRQPSQLIIESFTSTSRRWSRAPMERFLADVRAMGPGLFIIGLDFHVGLLIQTDDDLRFVHASYETRTVVDEPARAARPVIDSKYRVVGKLLGRANVRDWLAGRRIAVRGGW